MPFHPPALCLSGASVLHNGALHRQNITMAQGLLRPASAMDVDLSGYIIAPGAVDISSKQSTDHPDPDPERDLISAGITTAWLRHIWGWRHDRHSPDAVWRALRAWDTRATHADLRLQIQAECLIENPDHPLSDLLAQPQVSMLVLSDTITRELALADTAPDQFAQRAQADGTTADLRLAALRRAAQSRATLPRRLCKLGAQVDAAQMQYGSLYDHDGETREFLSQLGAKLCIAPRAASAAAIAHAVGDPVVLPAPALQAPTRGGPNPRALIKSGRCAALCSDGDPSALLRACFTLVDEGLRSFAQAWELVSTHPAHVMGLTDRGQIATGQRADLTIIAPQTRTIAATICAGRVTYAYGDILSRLTGAGVPLSIAAQ